jgi:hypothetical protein
LVRPPGSAVPFFVVKRAEIPRVQDRHAAGEATRDDLVGGMMQRITRHAFDCLAGAVSRSSETGSSP